MELSENELNRQIFFEYGDGHFGPFRWCAGDTNNQNKTIGSIWRSTVTEASFSVVFDMLTMRFFRLKNVSAISYDYIRLRWLVCGSTSSVGIPINVP